MGSDVLAQRPAEVSARRTTARRRYRGLLLGTACAALVASPAVGQETPAKPRPRLPVTIEAYEGDAGFEKFLAKLKAVIGRCDLQALHAMIAPSFYRLRDFGGTFDLARSAVENFDALYFPEGATGCDAESWKELAALMDTPTREPAYHTTDEVCIPAKPTVPGNAAASVKFDEQGWAAVIGADVNVRARPSRNAPAIEALDNEAVQALDEVPDEDPSSADRWIRIITPSGRKGYVTERYVTSFLPEQMCFGVDPRGRWWITGSVGGGD